MSHYRRRRRRHRHESRFEEGWYWLTGLWMIELAFWVFIGELVLLYWMILLEAWLLAASAVIVWYLIAGGSRMIRHRSTIAMEASHVLAHMRELNEGIGTALRRPLRRGWR